MCQVGIGLKRKREENRLIEGEGVKKEKKKKGSRNVYSVVNKKREKTWSKVKNKKQILSPKNEAEKERSKAVMK